MYCRSILPLAVVLAAAVAWSAEPSKEGKCPADELPPWITHLTCFGERADWSHDGNWIVVSAPEEFYRINVNNPCDVVQLTYPEHGHQTCPCFSPDDSKIIFSRKEQGKKKKYGPKKLHSINALDGSSLTKLLDTDHVEDRPGIRPF